MCLDDQILNTYIDGELAEPWKSSAEEHLKHCRVCEDRAEAITHLRQVLRSASVSDAEVASRKERVLSILEKNHLGKQKKKGPLSKFVNMKMSHLVGMAAAYTVVFVGAWSLLSGSHGQQNIPISTAQNNVVELSNITPVRDVQREKPKTLDDYSLEQILQYLDAKGYNVDLTLKGIQPLENSASVAEEPGIMETVETIEN